jgi:membrane protein DedA with SNARE-associated domain
VTDPSPADVRPSQVAAATETGRVRRWRRPLLVLAILRYVVPIAALPLIPVLLPDRVPLLMLVRPGREVQLAAGGLHRVNGEPDLWVAFLAFLPLMVGAVWVFFLLGRAWRPELVRDDTDGWLARIVPPEVFAQFRRLLERRGPMLAFIGRIGALPPTILAAAAGTSDVDARRYLVADFFGAIVGFAMTVGVGWALGTAYERGGWWLTIAGLLLFFAVVAWISNWIRRESERDGDGATTSPEPSPDG